MVAGHVRGALGLAEDVEQAAARSAKRHREFVRDRLGVVYDAGRVRRVAEAIRQAVQAKDDPADLINVALAERGAGPSSRLR
ncbi:hypothetical protein CLV72_1107 [Allonocardiopsis opalescens]|uniref:Uncharacterized protein n=1 Tax=Allonocardiopsis opalescens TaxID=1144618 RepID=A0A2T0PTM2_9ACTN|nr:hypothetical protein CLV72_1107 [Allonocardiopsis opalescens]